MSNIIELKKTDIPFWFGGDGVLKVDVNVVDPTKPIPPTDNDILAVDFNIGGSQPFSIGANDSFKFAVSASADAKLIPLWSSSSAARLKLLDDYGLHGFSMAARIAGRSYCFSRLAPKQMRVSVQNSSI